MEQDAGIHLSRCRLPIQRCRFTHTTQDAGKEQNHPSPSIQMLVQRKKPDTDSSLEAGLPDVISIVAAMLWSNHCDHPLPKFEKEKKEQKETQKIFSSTSVQNYGWMQQ